MNRNNKSSLLDGICIIMKRKKKGVDEMNAEIEKEIIRNFVVKSKQERILWELQSRKYRDSVAFGRFCGAEIFKAQCLYPVESWRSDILENYLLQLGGTQNAYVLSTNGICECSLKEALANLRGTIGIVYCGNGVGYYQGEPNPFKMPQYILLKEGMKFQPLK